MGVLIKKLFNFILASKIALNASPKASETTRNSLTVVCITPTGCWSRNRVIRLGPDVEVVVSSTLSVSACDVRVDTVVVVSEAVTPLDWGSREL